LAPDSCSAAFQDLSRYGRLVRVDKISLHPAPVTEFRQYLLCELM
jgi:hypothetical protein